MKTTNLLLVITIVCVTIQVGLTKRPRKKQIPPGHARRQHPQGYNSNVRYPEDEPSETPDESKYQEEHSPNQGSYNTTAFEYPKDGSSYVVPIRILTHPRAIEKLANLIREYADVFPIPITDSAIYGPRHGDPDSRFQDCVTPREIPGRCAYVRSCIRPKFLHNFDHFLKQVCYIGGRYLGVCCPEGELVRLSDRPRQEFIISVLDDHKPPNRQPIRPGQGGHRPVHPGGNGNFPSQPNPRPPVNQNPTTLQKPKPPVQPVIKPKPPAVKPPIVANGALYADCGLNFKTRIIGGKEADPKDWIWMAALLRQTKDQFCGGALISQHYVITAAHCLVGLEPRQIKVRLGEYDFNKKTSPDRQDYDVSAIKRHPSYNRTTNANDIALLKLNTPARFTDFVRPICLPEANKDFSSVQSTVAGWGTISYGGKSSPVLREVKVPVWRNSECETALPGRISSVFLCAGPKSGGKDSCQGDSGGPLMVENAARRWSIIGIVSWGIRCGEPNLPGVYTRVNRYLDWILKNAR